MSVNTMAIEDVYSLLSDLHGQLTGAGVGSISVDSSNFISVAQTTLQAGTDVVYNALMNTIAKTVFSVRPYSRQFKGLIVDNVKWGGIIRKIQFGDAPPIQDEAFHNIVDGQSVDHYVVNKGDVLETHYYGSDVYQDCMTVFRDQLVTAFEGPEQLGSFIAAKTQEMNNKWTQWTEELARTLLINAIAAKYHSAMYQSHVIHMITEYNTLLNLGTPLTFTDIWQPANVKSFWEYVRSRILTLSREMALRSDAFQYQIAVPGGGGRVYEINRHTPEKNQKIYLTSDFMDIMETSVLSEVFNDNYLKYADIEKVPTWQTNPSTSRFDSAKVDVSKYVVLDDYTLTGAYRDVTVSSGDEVISPILGVMFDEDFCAINIKDTIIQNTPMNARGLYYNTWLTANAQYAEDFTEKFVLLMLD